MQTITIFTAITLIYPQTKMGTRMRNTEINNSTLFCNSFKSYSRFFGLITLNPLIIRNSIWFIFYRDEDLAIVFNSSCDHLSIISICTNRQCGGNQWPTFYLIKSSFTFLTLTQNENIYTFQQPISEYLYLRSESTQFSIIVILAISLKSMFQ